jgi:AraC-like DNA-binding protein
VFRPLFESLPRVLCIQIGSEPAAAVLRELFQAGVRDAHVGRALALLHGDPGKAWTVDELAHDAGLSRSALAERFTSMVGESPMQYLTRWRLALAAQMLRAGREPIGRIAERSGYESEAAFSRAFKREFGEPPASWRKARAQAHRGGSGEYSGT